MKRTIVFIFIIILLTITIYSETVKIIKIGEYKIENVIPKHLVINFTSNEMIITKGVPTSEKYSIYIYSLKNKNEQIIKEKIPALYDINGNRRVVLVFSYGFKNKFWILTGNSQNGDMEIKEYEKKDGKYYLKKTLNLKTKAFIGLIEKENKENVEVSLGVKDS